MSPKPLDKSILIALGLVGSTACVCLSVIDTNGPCLSEEQDTDTDADSDTDTDADTDADTDVQARGELIERIEAALPPDVLERLERS